MPLARTLAAALAAAALAAPTALAQPADIHAPLIKPTTEANKQDHAARPDTAGNPSISATNAALAQERYYASYGKPAPLTRAGSAVADDTDAALAQERYYASHGAPAPLTKAGSAVAADTGDGIAPLPFVIALVGALLVGLAGGSALHIMHVSRRHATGLAA
jgi:hypothetical protein